MTGGVKKTAGPSTTLRFGRDDRSDWVPAFWHSNQFVIPTGAKRSGGTCCFFLLTRHLLPGKCEHVIPLRLRDHIRGPSNARERWLRHCTLNHILPPVYLVDRYFCMGSSGQFLLPEH